MADTSTMIPFDSSSDAWGAGFGAFIGSWLGNNFLGGNGNRVGTGASDLSTQNGFLEDNIARLSDQVSNGTQQMLSSQARQNETLLSGMGGLESALYQSVAGINQNVSGGLNTLSDVLQNSTTSSRMENMSNFNALNSNISNNINAVNSNMSGNFNVLNSNLSNGLNALNGNLSNGLNMLNSNMGDRCCAIQNSISTGFGNLALENCHNTSSIMGAIGLEGSATRQLIQNNLITDLQSQLNDAKNKVTALETQAYTSNAITNQSALFDAKLTSAVSTLINALKTTSTTTATA